MKNTITLPMDRVAALVVETHSTPEAAISNLLSVLHSRRMWAHLDERKSSKDVAVFVYGSNVPTPTRSRRPARTRKGAA